MSIRRFMQENYKHFNAAVAVDAAQGWVDHLDGGGKMLLSMAGAMSTAELGISLAEMIRRDKVQIICCTGANLEEDFFNLVAHDHYERVPNYRYLTAEDEQALLDRGLNRVTDTCIPEEEAMRLLEHRMLEMWKRADAAGERYFPYEYFYQLIDTGQLKELYQIDPANSWMLAAREKNIPVLSPGWEDSTLGNIFVANVMQGKLSGHHVMKSGTEQMQHLVDWYREHSAGSSIGFFQIGGGIAGDFPICVVPLITQDLRKECPVWGYFAQISDSTTSFGSYSGAVPNEKITWGKLGVETPSFVIESDASIVAPLVFRYVMDL